MPIIQEALDTWRTSTGSRDAAYADLEKLREAEWPAVFIEPRGRGGMVVDVNLMAEARGVPSGPVAKVYVNDYRSRDANPAREELLAVIARAVAAWASA